MSLVTCEEANVGGPCKEKNVDFFSKTRIKHFKISEPDDYRFFPFS